MNHQWLRGLREAAVQRGLRLMARPGLADLTVRAMALVDQARQLMKSFLRREK